MFQNAVEKVLKTEGGYVDHPDDKGGATNFGITEQTLAQFRGTPVSHDDVRNLTKDEAIAIYEKFYWKPMGLDQVTKPKIATILFDQAVNRGMAGATRSIQRVLGLKVDGKIGPVSILAINACSETSICLALFEDAQLQYVDIVQKNPLQVVFLEGWIRRTHSLLDVAFEV